MNTELKVLFVLSAITMALTLQTAAQIPLLTKIAAGEFHSLALASPRGVALRKARWECACYEYPRGHPELGMLSPDIEKLAKTLAGKDRIRLQPADWELGS